MVLSALGWWYYNHRTDAARGLLVGVSASLIGVSLGALVLAFPLGIGEMAEACSPDYQPCVPVEEDVDCVDIRKQVTVIGTDAYGLDRDGDGIACEFFPLVPA
jgi:hypothetical protein